MTLLKQQISTDTIFNKKGNQPRVVGLSDGEESLRICLLVSTQYTNMMDRHTLRQTLHDNIGCAYACVVRQKTVRLQCSLNVADIFCN